MPKLVIDDQQIDVAPGTKVIEAAAQLGIMIPRFCYHPALGSVGACRVCAVKFLQGPFKGLQMSCMIEAKDGMVVSTTDEEAVDFRKYVIEWLMLNHPHDCPVCDEGGHCLLQDMTVSGGHGIRKYRGKKRTYPDQYLGSLLQHEMNRCIHCYRCSRYYQEFTGYHDLGVMRIGNRTYFGRFKEGRLHNPFSGNLADICPTGVYTDKPSRFFGRRWDYQRSPSLCINCSLGCHTTASARYREVKRQEARFSEAVNGYFICDRGRYGFFYASQQSRPRRAKINGKDASFDEAVRTARQKLAEISKGAGPSATAAVGSPRASLETQTMLQYLCRLNGWREPIFFMDPTPTSKVKTAIDRLEAKLTVSLREVEGADFILAVGTDPINEAPMLALAMRQAQRKGARVVVLDPRPVSLPFDFIHIPVSPDELSDYFMSFFKIAVDQTTAELAGDKTGKFYHALAGVNTICQMHAEIISATAQDLQQSQRPIVVCGTQVGPDMIPGLAADAALCLQAMKKKTGLFYVMPGANAFFAGLLSDIKETFPKLVEDIENGSVKALILAEADPWRYFSDRKRLQRAFDTLELLIVLDYINSEAAQQAHIFLPATTLFESGGVFINQEGRVQAAPPVLRGGTPIAETGSGDHPPRIYGNGIPGADQKPAWVTLAKLVNGKAQSDENKLRKDIWTWLTELLPEFARIPSFNEIPEEGIRLHFSGSDPAQFSLDWTSQPGKRNDQGDNLELIFTDWTYGTEELSGFSPCLRELEREPCLSMHSKDAVALDLINGDDVAIHTDTGNLEVKLCVVENMACSSLILPRHRLLPWQNLGTGRIRICRDKIIKVKSK